MTSIVGIQCNDGVVIAADSSATFGVAPNHKTIEQITLEKICVIGNVIVAGTGEVGLGQRACNFIQKLWDGKQFSDDPFSVTRRIAHNVIKDFHETFVRSGSYGALVAFPVGHKLFLCEFDQVQFQPELKTGDLWYCSMGSAQQITDPFLALMRDVFWVRGRPNLSDGTFAALWALQHAVDVNPGGVGGPVHVATLALDKKSQPFVKILKDSDLELHRMHIEGAKNCLRHFRESLSQDVSGIPKKN